MDLMILIFLAVVMGLICATVFKYLDNTVDLPLFLLFGFCVCAVIFLIGGAIFLIDAPAKKAQEQAKTKCAPYKAEVYTDTDKETVVFSCEPDKKLQTIRYGQ